LRSAKRARKFLRVPLPPLPSGHTLRHTVQPPRSTPPNTRNAINSQTELVLWVAVAGACQMNII
jgi:hypothetical protein